MLSGEAPLRHLAAALQKAVGEPSGDPGTLAEQVRGPAPLVGLLNSVRTAPDLQSALRARQRMLRIGLRGEVVEEDRLAAFGLDAQAELGEVGSERTPVDAREAEERMNAGYECVDWYFCKKDLD